MPREKSITRLRMLLTLGAGLTIGIPAGVGVFAVWCGRGMSYLSNDPAACANCHIMREQLASWQKSGHHHVATCNDCHTPGNLVQKYWAKALNGYHHSKAFTTGNFHEPIQIKEGNRMLTESACRSCHGQLLANHPAMTADGSAGSCLHCHRGVGHL